MPLFSPNNLRPDVHYEQLARPFSHLPSVTIIPQGSLIMDTKARTQADIVPVCSLTRPHSTPVWQQLPTPYGYHPNGLFARNDRNICPRMRETSYLRIPSLITHDHPLSRQFRRQTTLHHVLRQ